MKLSNPRTSVNNTARASWFSLFNKAPASQASNLVKSRRNYIPKLRTSTKVEEMLTHIGFTLDNQGDNLSQALDNLHDGAPIFGDLMPINYGEKSVNWFLFYKYIISPFSNPYKQFIKRYKKIEVVEKVESKKQKSFKQKKAQKISLNHEEERELTDLVSRICELDTKAQKELLFANPLNASGLKQLRFLSKYATKMNSFIGLKRKQREGTLSCLPANIRKTIVKNMNKIGHIQGRNGVSSLGPKNESRHHSLNLKKHKLFDSLEECDFAMNQLEEIRVKTRHPLLFRGKSCCCSSCGGDAYRKIQTKINLFMLPKENIVVKPFPRKKLSVEILKPTIHLPQSEVDQETSFDNKSMDNSRIIEGFGKFAPFLQQMRDHLQIPGDTAEPFTPFIPSQPPSPGINTNRKTKLLFDPLILNTILDKKRNKREEKSKEKRGILEDLFKEEWGLSEFRAGIEKKRRNTQLGIPFKFNAPGKGIAGSGTGGTPRTPCSDRPKPPLHKILTDSFMQIEPKFRERSPRSRIHKSGTTRHLIFGDERRSLWDSEGINIGERILRPINLSKFEGNTLEQKTLMSNPGGSHCSLPNSPTFTTFRRKDNYSFKTSRSNNKTPGRNFCVRVNNNNNNGYRRKLQRKQGNPFHEKLPTIRYHPGNFKTKRDIIDKRHNSGERPIVWNNREIITRKLHIKNKIDLAAISQMKNLGQPPNVYAQKPKKLTKIMHIQPRLINERHSPNFSNEKEHKIIRKLLNKVNAKS